MSNVNTTTKILSGPRDAFSLLALAGATATTLPFTAGDFLFPAIGVTMALAAGAGMMRNRAEELHEPFDIDAKQQFVLPSDEVYQTEGILVGYTTDFNEPITIPYDYFMRHFALIGGSGVGKTTLGLWVLYQNIVKGGGWIFIDAKIDADTRDALGYMARTVGREDELYVINVDDPSCSNTYNPLLNGDPDEIAARLLNLLPSSEDNPGADFYRQAVNHALVVIVGALQASKTRYTFNDISIMMQSPEALERVLRRTPDGTDAKMQLEIFLDKYRKKEKGAAVIDVNKMKDTLGGMAGRAAAFSQGKFGKVFNHYAPEVDITKIMLENKMLYCMLPTMGKDASALNLGKMLISDIRTAVYNLQGIPPAERPWPPFIVFADEMGSYVMPGMARLFEQARSAQVALIPGFQAFGNLAVVGDDFKDIVMQNTWTKAIYRSGSSASAEEASEIIGKVKKYQYTFSESSSTGESAQGIKINPQFSETDSGGTGASYREVEEPRVSPEKFTSLDIGQCIIQVGARMYHVKVPRLTTPLNDEKKGETRHPDMVFKPLRHPTKVPAGINVLDFESHYKELLMASIVEMENVEKAQQEALKRQAKQEGDNLSPAAKKAAS